MFPWCLCAPKLSCRPFQNLAASTSCLITSHGSVDRPWLGGSFAQCDGAEVTHAGLVLHPLPVASHWSLVCLSAFTVWWLLLLFPSLHHEGKLTGQALGLCHVLLV